MANSSYTKPRFSDQDCVHLLAEVPPDPPIGLPEIQDRLNRLTGAFLASYNGQVKTQAPSKLARRFRGISGRARVIVARSNDDGAADPVPTIKLRDLATDLQRTAGDYGLRYLPEEVTDLLDNKAVSPQRQQTCLVALISFSNLLARRCALQSERNKRSKHIGHQGNIALDGLFGDLIGLWMTLIQRLPGVSRSLKNGCMEPSGPVLRFIDIYLAMLRDHLGSEVLEQERGLCKLLNPSKAAIFERLRKLGFSGMEKKIAKQLTRTDPNQ